MEKLTNTIDALKACVEAAYDAVVIVDEEDRLIYFNEGYRALIGKAARKLRIGQTLHCRDLIGLEVCQEGCVVKRARELGCPVRMHEVRARRDDEDLTLELSAVAIPGVGVVEAFRDVTGEQRVQQRYREMLKQERLSKRALEFAVYEATKDLKQANLELRETQGQLVHSEKMASLGQLVAGIAHEINNPINFMQANIPFVREHFEALDEMLTIFEAHMPDGDHAEEIAAAKERLEIDYVREDITSLLKTIGAGVARTASIIADLKSFSRMGETSLQDADLLAGIDTSIALLSPLLRDRVVIHRDYCGSFKVRCNAGPVNQVLMNLLTNAAQAIEGEGEITISAWVEDEHAIVEIRDTGPGIPEEIKGKIFDPFFTTKGVGKGTGLGLSISFGIVRDHGGTLEMQNMPQGGALARVKLPGARKD